MLKVLNLLSGLALIATALAPVLHFTDALGETGMKLALMVAMVVWFGASIARQSLAKTD